MSGRLPGDARRLVRLGNVRRDLDEELRFHFERTVEELMSEGMDARDAREEAARRFGDESQYRRDLEHIDRKAARKRSWLERTDALRQMMTQATRSLVRSPGLTTGVVLVFALGIGANATMVGIIDRLLLRAPSHITDPDNVRHLFIEQYVDFMGERITDPGFSYPDYNDMKAVKSFSSVAAGSGRVLTIGVAEEAHQVEAELVTGNFFALLGTRPAVGRFLNESDDRIGGSQEVVLSYNMWQREYAGDRDAIGRTLDFGYGPYTIVGVAPRGFTSVGLRKVDVWLPLHVAAAQILGDGWMPEPDGRNWQWIEVVARIAPGTTMARAEAEATAVHQRARAASIAAGDWGKDPKIIAASIIEARAPGAPGTATVAKLLAAVSLMVLLIACVNVANLLLARSVKQQRETAVRLALGISRRRLIGQIVLEGVLLATLGGVAALAVEHWGGDIVRRTLLPQVSWDDVAASSLVIPSVLALALLAGIVSALVPALQVGRRDVSDTIRQATAGGITRSTSRVRAILALAQTALSVLLLIGAGLFVRSLNNVRSLDLGFEPEGLYFAEPGTLRDAFTSAENVATFNRGIDRLSRMPGVQAVAAASTMPFRSRRTTRIRAQDVDSVVRPPSGGPYHHGVTPGYFDAMGIRIVRGRGVQPTDVATAPHVVVVSARLGEYLWHGEDPIGKCLYIGSAQEPPPCTSVVGVSEDASNVDLRDEGMLQYYVPLAQEPENRRTASWWLIRVRTIDPQVTEAIRREIMAIDSRIRFARVSPYQETIDPKTSAWKLGATMFGLFGFLALLVAAIGLYSVLAFDIAQRTRELGLRTALGASAATLMKMVVGRAVMVTSLGLLLGGSTALLLAPQVQSMLFETSARDPFTFGAVGAALTVVALVAAALPGWRAMRVDPNVALRAD